MLLSSILNFLEIYSMFFKLVINFNPYSSQRIFINTQSALVNIINSSKRSNISVNLKTDS